VLGRKEAVVKELNERSFKEFLETPDLRRREQKREAALIEEFFKDELKSRLEEFSLLASVHIVVLGKRLQQTNTLDNGLDSQKTLDTRL
jgi:DNA-binding transcriptional regulator YbjK